MSEPADKTAASTVGHRLRAARERQGLTLQKVSEDLHLDLPVVEAMEENRFRALGAPVYARGHLRKYAQLLGLDVEAVLASYEAEHAGPVEPKLVPSTTEHPAMPPERRTTPLRLALVGGALALVAATAVGAWWYLSARRGAESPPIATPPVAQEAASARDTVASVPAPAVEEAAARERPNLKPLQPARPAAPAATPADGSSARLRLHFLADSWVEIYDATGARLLFDQRVAESARTVVGVPPFKVLLGNYAAVEMTLDGRPVVVPDRARYGATARFRVMPGGSTLASWGT
jgi:cytoskeleton protein RodZ